MNVLKEAIEYVRSGNGPYFIEYDCFRYHGQWEGDPQNYKNPEETAYYWEHDPIKLFRQGALERGLLTVEELDAVEKNGVRQEYIN